MKIHVSPRALIARVRLETGEFPTASDLKACLQACGINYGVDETALRLLACSLTRPISRVVARGLPPERGRGGALMLHGALTPPAARREGIQYIRTLGASALVAEGEPIARRAPAERGYAGISVKGKPVAGRKGPEAVLRPGANCRVSPDGLEIHSLAAGRPVIHADRIAVEPVLRVEGSRITASKPIRTDGHVFVTGNLGEGAEIHSGGHVNVDGAVEGGRIWALGTVTVHGAVRQHATIETLGGLVARSVEGSRLRAVGDVKIAGDVRFSEVETFGQVHAGGRILGGVTMACRAVMALSIGGKGEFPTLVALSPERRPDHWLIEVEARLQEVRSAFGCTTDPGEGMEIDYRGLVKGLILLRAEKHAHVAPRIEVAHAIHRGVHIELNGARMVTDRLHPPAILMEAGGRIHARPLIA